MAWSDGGTSSGGAEPGRIVKSAGSQSPGDATVRAGRNRRNGSSVNASMPCTTPRLVDSHALRSPPEDQSPGDAAGARAGWSDHRRNEARTRSETRIAIREVDVEHR